MGKLIAFCSGCGGTGRTTIAVEAARCAARLGKRVILLDASGISRSADLLLGVENSVALDLTDVLLGNAELKTVTVRVPGTPGLVYVSASLHEFVGLSAFGGQLLALRALSDLLIVDMPTGEMLRDTVIGEPSDGQLIVSRTDAASVRACEGMLLRNGSVPGETSLILNGLSPAEAADAMTEFAVRAVLDHPVEIKLTEEPGLRARGLSAAPKGFGSTNQSELEALVRRWF